MQTNELLEQKQANFRKALNRQEPDYVPNMIYNGTASVAWAGKRTVNLMDDPQAYVEALTAVFDEMWVDVSLLCGNFFTPKRARAFPNCETLFGPDGNTPEHIQLSPMQKDEYDQLIADPDRYVTEVLIPRKHPDFCSDREAAKEALKLYAEDKAQVISLLGLTHKILIDRYGVDEIVSFRNKIQTPLDILFDNFRGFRGTLTDLRRQPDNVRAALDKLWEVRRQPDMEQPLPDPDMWGPQMCHIPAYLSPKQFEELYWPHQKKQIERIAALGSKAYIVTEGRWEKIMHHFLEVPKDSCVLHVDDDDILKVHELLGDHQIICGGLKIAETRMKTFEQIKDDTMRIIDTCAPGGGFLYSTDKTWIAAGDVNQTLIDAYNFVHEYSKK